MHRARHHQIPMDYQENVLTIDQKHIHMGYTQIQTVHLYIAMEPPKKVIHGTLHTMIVLLSKMSELIVKMCL